MVTHVWIAVFLFAAGLSGALWLVRWVRKGGLDRNTGLRRLFRDNEEAWMRYCKSITADVLFLGALPGVGYLVSTDEGVAGLVASYMAMLLVVGFWTLHFLLSYYDVPRWLIPPQYREHRAPMRAKVDMWWRRLRP